MSITVPYKVMPKGYRIRGNVRTGYRATVPYLVAWDDAFTFADQILGKTAAPAVGPITWITPYLFPATAARMYAQDFEIEPAGANGEVPIPTGGLKPGEYFTHAKVTVLFETPEMIQTVEDDPTSMSQLDPDNPITMCKQSVRSSGKMETRKGAHFIYDSDGKPVPGEFALPTTESQLVLTFPRVPYLPWKLIRPYLNKINSVELLGVGVGELLFEDMATDVTPGPNGGLQQSVQLVMSVTPESGVTWNHVPKPNGTLDLVRIAADSGSGSPRRIYGSADFREIFNQLSYTAGA